MRSAEVVICGAGIAGVALAHELTIRHGMRDVVLCDPRPPLTLTSDKSTECYRNLWPNAPMVALMNRSIDIVEELARDTGNAIGLNRRGYVYVTAQEERLSKLIASAEQSAGFGAGPVRIHDGTGPDTYVPAAADGWESDLTGADVLADPALLHRHFAGLSDEAIGAIHVRRAGWLSAQQMGAIMLERARDAGLVLIPEEITAVDTTGGKVGGVTLASGERIGCRAFVNAAGPMLGQVAAMLGESLPVHSEAHHRVSFTDPLDVIPRDVGLMIWTDPQHIRWSDEERALLVEAGRSDLIDELPSTCHGRPEGARGSSWILALWEYRRTVIEPVWPMPVDDLYAEVVIRGMAALYPGMNAYADRLPRSVVDGGYYTKTVENRPLAGPLRTEGAFVAGALSGFGIMAACGVADLTAAHIVGASLPDHAPAFALSRYDDPGYLEEIAALTETGQL